MKQHKELIVINTGSYGGEQSATLQLLPHFQNTFTVRYFLFEKYHRYQLLRILRVVLNSLFVVWRYRNTKKYVFYTPSVISAGALILGSLGFANVYFHYHGQRVSSISSMIKNTVSPIHSLLLDLPSMGIVLFLQYLALRGSRKIFVPLERTKQQLQSAYSYLMDFRVVVVSNGVDRSIFYPKQGHHRRAMYQIGYAGRPDVEKGLFVLMEAVQKMSSSRKLQLNFAFAMYPQEKQNVVLSQIKFYRQYFPITVNINLDKKQLAAFYNDQDICVLASFREQFSLMFMEAASCGIPTLLSPLVQHREIAERIDMNLLMYGFDSDSLVRSLLLICDMSRAGRNKLSRRLSRWSRDYSWGKAAQNIIHYLH